MSEWIKWEGGSGIPVHRNTIVDVRFRDGKEVFGMPASDYGWRQWSSIAEYRLSRFSGLEDAYDEADRPVSESSMRQFGTGATRNLDAGKLDFEGFLSPLVIERFAEYMNKNRKQADGSIRDADNWQKGMPQDTYMKSGWRHFFDWWKEHRGCGVDTDDHLEESICALIFNAQGYLHEHLKNRRG